MIAFLDLQWVTQRRRQAELRRARRIFAATALGTLGLALAAWALAIHDHPWLATLVMVAAAWCYAFNCSALGRLCQLARERREEGRSE